jgi:hypothetical protein
MVGATVTLVAGREKAELLAGLGVVGRAIDFDSLPMHELFGEGPAGDRRLADMVGRHDRIISCFLTGGTAPAQRLAELCGASSAAFLPVRPSPGSDRHLLNVWTDALNMPPPPAGFAAWKVPPAWRTAATAVLVPVGIGQGQQYVVLHPGAGSPLKCWPLERWFDLAERLGPDKGVLFLLGPVEQEKWGRGDLENLASRFPTLVGPRLRILAGVLAGAAGYVGGDSGPTHLAAGVGARLVALFGPTRPENFAPVGPDVRVLAAGAMADITPADVLAALASP